MQGRTHHLKAGGNISCKILSLRPFFLLQEALLHIL
jgi:hypothetical protein